MTSASPPNSILAQIGGTPLVELRSIGRGLGRPLLAKCEHLNPTGSVKDRIALAIVEDAERRGVLQRGDTLVEATAGNTGMGLCLVAAARGYRVVCVMPRKMSTDKQRILRLLGAEVIVTPNAPPSNPDNFQNVARRLASERGWFLTDQFENSANVRVHETTTGPELLSAVGGPIAAFVAGSGTGGTITGVARYLKNACPSAQIVLADPVGSVLAEWVRTGNLGHDGSYAVEGIGSSEPPALLQRELIHDAVSVADEESFQMTLRLMREEGLLVGGSSGTAVAAALEVARRDDLGSGPVVVLLPDSWDRYPSQSWFADA